MPWKSQLSDLGNAEWWRHMIHWYSEWIAFCPILTIASSRNGQEKESAENRFLSKFLFSILIQVVVAVMGAAGGSYITIQIVTYRMDRAEETIKTIQTRQFRNEDRLTESEAKLREIAMRHMMEERMQK